METLTISTYFQNLTKLEELEDRIVRLQAEIAAAEYVLKHIQESKK